MRRGLELVAELRTLLEEIPDEIIHAQIQRQFSTFTAAEIVGDELTLIERVIGKQLAALEKRFKAESERVAWTKKGKK